MPSHQNLLLLFYQYVHFQPKVGTTEDNEMWMSKYEGKKVMIKKGDYIDYEGNKIIDPYNPKSSTTHVGFSTTKNLYKTDPGKCHINCVVEDSDWEGEFARVAEQHPNVI